MNLPRFPHLWCVVAAFLGLASGRALGAEFVSFTGSYAQNFDGLPNTAGENYSGAGAGPLSLSDTVWATSPAFTTTGLDGWQIYKTAGSSGAGLVVGDGGGTAAGALSYGATGSTERALGALAGTTRVMTFGVVLRNDTGATITSVVVDYTGEQWRQALATSGATPVNPVNNTLSFGYKVGTGIDITGTFTGVPALNFESIHDAAGTGALNGNDEPNRTHLNATIPVNWAPGDYLVLRWADANETGNDHGIAVDDLSITVPTTAQAPSITTPPQSQTVAIGATVTFTAEAGGTTPLTYQWKKATTDLTDGGRIEGTTTAALKINGAQLEDAGDYSVVVTNTAGSATSSAATLVVNTPPATSTFVEFTGSYTQNFDGLPNTGTSTQYTATTDGPLSLSDTSWSSAAFATTGLGGWQIYETGGSNTAALIVGDGGGSVSGACSYGATGSTEHALGSLGGSARIMAFGVVLRNDTGATITSVVVSYTGEQWRLGRTDETPPTDTLSFGYKTGTETDITGTFVEATGLNFVTPVTVGTVGALDGNAAANRTALSATLSSLTWAPGEYLVLRWSDANESGNDHGIAVDDLSVIVPSRSSAPVIVTQPQSQTTTVGATASLTVVASGTAPLSYQWKKGGTDVTDGGRIAGATTATLQITGAQLDDAGDYSVVVTNSAGSATSSAATLVVNAAPASADVVAFTGSYTQDFDGLPNTGGGTYSATTDGPLSLNDTSWSATAFTTVALGGWQIYETAGSSNAALFVGDGSGTASGAFSYGTAGSTERALGSLGGSGRTMAFGVVLRNDTGATITNVVISYTGEQWRLGDGRAGGTTPADTLSFGYKTGTGVDITGTFADVAALNFVTPVTAGTAGALDGSAAANRTSLSATLSSLAWAPGDFLVLRWSDLNEVGNDHGVAIDDLSIAAPGVSLAPAIVTPPESQTATEGDTVSLAVEAIGAPTLTYQWRKGGATIDGATQATLTFANVQLSDAGDYTVTVSNDHGTVTSAVASLTVNPLIAPAITTQPGGQTILEGQNATFTVVATGTATLTYQWRKGGVDVTDGERIDGATTDTLAITGAHVEDAGDYTVVVANRAGSVTSLTATLAISAAPVPTAPIAKSATDITRNGFTISWSSLPYATGYRVDLALDPAFSNLVSGYENLDVGANLSLAVTGLSSGTTYYYRVRAYNSSGTSGNSATVLVTTEAGQAPAITSGDKTTFTVGVPSSFTVRATGSQPILFTATGLPAWASLNAETGVLSGTAPAGTASTTVVLTITASNDTPSKATQTFTLNLDAIPAIANPLIVSTLAGQAGTSGVTNGTGGAARFNEPLGAVADSAGVIYVADSANHTIRKVTAAGAVTTFAGKAGTAGSADGTGTVATFNAPSDLAIDSAGNLYVADTLNHTIRKITSAGAVTTLAGQAGSAGSADGTGAAARFAGPQGVAVSGDTLYVADTGNHTIRKIDLSTVAVTAVAGQAGVAGSTDATGTAATFNFPSDLVVGAEGRIYVADTENNVIRAIAADGAVTTLAGLAGSTGAADGSGSAARFNQPSAIVADGTGATLYVIDTDNHTVRQVVGATGTVTTLAGLAGTAGSDDGMGAAARFNLPSGIAWTSNSLLIADTANHTLRKGLFPAAIVIAAQPQDRTVTTGNTAAAFTVTATGQPAPTYQWYFNGAAIAGATSSSYAVANAQSANAGTYWVVVSNALGSVKSDEVTLTVRDPGEPHGAAAGGGGAPGVWFLLALSLLAAARRMVVRR